MVFDVAGTQVGGDRAWVIAEIGHNHGGDPDKAAELIRIAALGGCDAVKFQVRSNRDLYTRRFYEQEYNSENAFGRTYGEHREALELPESVLGDLQDEARSYGLACFATAFDIAAVDRCMDLGFPAIKLASGSITNTPLITYAASQRVPLFMSTGAAHLEDVKRAVRAADGSPLSLLQCTATYPSEWEELDLAVINTYRFLFPHAVIGYSSHTSGISDGPVAYALGARVFEKHITYDRAAKGTDHAFSLEPNGLRRFVRDIRRAEVAIGDGRKKFHLNEASARAKMGGGIYTRKPLRAGAVLCASDVCIKSPGAYIEPHELLAVIGKEVLVDLAEETPLSWEVLSEHVSAQRPV